MAKLRPYLALDLETTGLDVEKSHILQIGFVIDDGVSPLDKLEKGTFFIENPVIKYGENYALGMNAWIFQELMKKASERKYPTYNLADGIKQLFLAIERTRDLARKFDQENGNQRSNGRVQLAGKNVSNFDWPIVLNNYEQNNLTIQKPGIDHRFIDVGTAFFDLFGFNPGFDKINKLIQYKDITHDALDDALNVVVALRYRMGMNF